MGQSNAETGPQVIQYRQDSRQALSAELTKARNQRCISVVLIYILERATKEMPKFLVDSTRAANTPLAPFDVRVNMSVGLAADTSHFYQFRGFSVTESTR